MELTAEGSGMGREVDFGEFWLFAKKWLLRVDAIRVVKIL
jgi:hypothetical protein